MTSNEMASQDVFEQRQAIVEHSFDENRGDWYEAHREEILRSNGIDPSNVWSFDPNDDSGSEPDGGD